MSRAEDANQELVDALIARGALRSPGLIAAFRATPRHLFLDRVWQHREARWREWKTGAPTEDDLRLAYADRALTTRLLDTASSPAALAISSSSQPSLMAEMLEDLQLAPTHRVLEVGAGTGYNAALLACVVAEVSSIDVDRAVLGEAQRHLGALPDRQVRLYHGDGRLGLAERAPFDRIQVTAAADDLAPAWLEQLAPRGLIQAPLDIAPGLAWLVQGTVRDGAFEGGLTRPAYFMPLRDEGSAGRDRNEPDSPLAGPEHLTAARAPWAAWQERHSGPDANDFLPHLALLAWLEGLALGHATCPDGRAGHGVADPSQGETCWMGPYQWYVTGDRGLALGQRLWRLWLDLGGPQASAWRLRAVPAGERLPREPAPRARYRRAGPRCEQVWELV